jgi:DNA-directed RNA polymerase omega subunit
LITQHEQLDIAIQKVGNRYVTTMLIAKRIRQLNHGARPRVERQEGENNFSVAVREIAEGHITLELQTASPVSQSTDTANSNGASDEATRTSDPAAQE